MVFRNNRRPLIKEHKYDKYQKCQKNFNENLLKVIWKTVSKDALVEKQLVIIVAVVAVVVVVVAVVVPVLVLLVLLVVAVSLCITNNRFI